MCFDNELFDTSEEEAVSMSIQQRWVLETGYTALHKAGYTKDSLRGL